MSLKCSILLNKNRSKRNIKKFILETISSLIIINELVTNTFALTGMIGAIIHKDCMKAGENK